MLPVGNSSLELGYGRWLLSLLVGTALGAGSPAVAQARRAGASPSGAHPEPELTRDAERAVEEGVAYLARLQRDRSGSWPCTPQRYRMSVSALAGLALLAHGDTPTSGRYARNVRKLIEWMLDAQRRYAEVNPPLAGLLFDLEEESRDDRPMHGHGFALLFLAEAYGNTARPELRRRLHEAIHAAVRVTANSISRDGGWYYHPVARPGQQYLDEGSVTVTQIQALRAANNAGIEVDAGLIDRAVRYLHASQDRRTGGIRYRSSSGRTSAALTAAGVTCFHGAGIYGGAALERAYDYLRLTLDPSQQQDFFYYTHLYGAQAMFQRGGPEWADYFPKIRRELLARRGGRPYWKHRFGKAYATAIALLILQIPKRYLPIFQR
ncbi:MAG: hypothetical protein D6731_06265 [Planctomycetota bacterium]|nr:MAG: hypothetical protein D6731_06265 [Planctomycetota bacterium]